MSQHDFKAQLDRIIESACAISDLNHDGNPLTIKGRDEIDRQVVLITMSARAMQSALRGQGADRRRQVAA